MPDIYKKIIRRSKREYLRLITSFRKVRDLYWKAANRRFLNSQTLEDVSVAPIFIIGPPRCGSTLFYQAMTHYFNFCYFTNEMMQNPYAVPFNVHKKDYSIEYESDFRSSFGKTEGPNAPHEGWPFWRRFYPRNVHDYIESPLFLNNDQEKEIFETVYFLQQYYKRPFITKNIETSMRLHSLLNIFTKAFCIVLKRDPLATASSIYKGRKRRYGDTNKWMGVKPKNYEILKYESVPRQIIGQILAVYETFYHDINDYPYLEISYESFCESPTATMHSVAEFLRTNGMDIEKSGQPLPKSFNFNKRLCFSLDERKEMVEILNHADIFKEHLYSSFVESRNCK